ncbi:chemotaxis protein CheW [Niveispirillum fermenti]|uniref:chemotaxis protein CheW n=1 Tax=Niveispirillum fermenti TaxID=1233113 RepID=UPI003A8611BA
MKKGGWMDAVQAAAMATDDALIELLLFSLEDRPYAIRIDRVERVVAMAAVVPMPGAPPVVAGVINLGGRFLPVLDVRARLGLAVHAPRLTDGLVIVRLQSRSVALWVDHVDGTISRAPDDLVPVEKVVAAGGYFDAVTALPDGPLFIHDVDRFLSLAEEQALDAALARGVGEHGTGA